MKNENIDIVYHGLSPSLCGFVDYNGDIFF